VLTVKSMSDVLSVWVKDLQDLVSITGLTCGEYKYFEVLVQVSQYFLSVGPDVDPGLDDSPVIKPYPYLDIMLLAQGVITMNQRLIQIKNQRLFIYITS
jgi:hypothetical protein